MSNPSSADFPGLPLDYKDPKASVILYELGAVEFTGFGSDLGVVGDIWAKVCADVRKFQKAPPRPSPSLPLPPPLPLPS